MPPSSWKTTATAASWLPFLAAASLTVASVGFFFFFFKVSFLLSLTTKRTLTANKIRRITENAFHWRLVRWMGDLSDPAAFLGSM